MAVVGFAQIMDRPRGSFSLGKYSVRVAYRVIVDSIFDGPQTVASAPGLPVLYSVYSFGTEINGEMLLRTFEAEPIGSSPTMAWKVEAVYETQSQKESKGSDSANRNTGGGTGRQTPGEFTNPLLEMPSVKWHSSGKEALLTRIYDNLTGTFKPCTASNGEIFDPPPKYLEPFATLEITRNEPIGANQPGIALQYANAVNSDVFWGMSPGFWRIKEIVPERQDRQIPGGPFKFSYLRVTYSFEFNPQTWDLFLLDYGSYYWQRPANASPTVPGAQPARRTIIRTFDGHPTSAPLNGRGQPLPDRAPWTPTVQATPDLTHPIISIAPTTPPQTFNNGDVVQLSGLPPASGARPVAPAGLSFNAAYYVCDVVTTPGPVLAGQQTMNLSLTNNGNRIAISDIGTGWQYIYSPGVFFNVRPYARLPFAFLGLPQSFAQVQ